MSTVLQFERTVPEVMEKNLYLYLYAVMARVYKT